MPTLSQAMSHPTSLRTGITATKLLHPAIHGSRSRTAIRHILGLARRSEKGKQNADLEKIELSIEQDFSFRPQLRSLWEIPKEFFDRNLRLRHAWPREGISVPVNYLIVVVYTDVRV